MLVNVGADPCPTCPWSSSRTCQCPLIATLLAALIITHHNTPHNFSHHNASHLTITTVLLLFHYHHPPLPASNHLYDPIHFLTVKIVSILCWYKYLMGFISLRWSHKSRIICCIIVRRHFAMIRSLIGCWCLILLFVVNWWLSMDFVDAFFIVIVIIIIVFFLGFGSYSSLVLSTLTIQTYYCYQSQTSC